MRKFYYLENEATADVAFVSEGANIEETLANTCLALMDVMVDLAEIDALAEFSFSIKAEDLEGLVYDLLDHLLFLFDTDYHLFKEITCKLDINTFELQFTGRGEKYDPEKHPIKTHIKAVTFFGMEIETNRIKITLDL